MDFASPRFGRSILQCAVERRNADAVRMLIHHGADTNRRLRDAGGAAGYSDRRCAGWDNNLLALALKQVK